MRDTKRKTSSGNWSLLEVALFASPVTMTLVFTFFFFSPFYLSHFFSLLILVCVSCNVFASTSLTTRTHTLFTWVCMYSEHFFHLLIYATETPLSSRLLLFSLFTFYFLLFVRDREGRSLQAQEEERRSRMSIINKFLGHAWLLILRQEVAAGHTPGSNDANDDEFDCSHIELNWCSTLNLLLSLYSLSLYLLCMCASV